MKDKLHRLCREAPIAFEATKDRGDVSAEVPCTTSRTVLRMTSDSKVSRIQRMFWCHTPYVTIHVRCPSAISTPPDGDRRTAAVRKPDLATEKVEDSRTGLFSHNRRKLGGLEPFH